jgi:hypothetical protein
MNFPIMARRVHKAVQGRKTPDPTETLKLSRMDLIRVNRVLRCCAIIGIKRKENVMKISYDLRCNICGSELRCSNEESKKIDVDPCDACLQKARDNAIKMERYRVHWKIR